MMICGCVTTGKDKNPTSEAKETNDENKIYLNELAKNQEYIQKLEKMNSDYIQENLNLLDELELAIQKEKEETYNEGFEHGKKIATDELIKNGYVIVKLEDLQKLGLWEE